MGTEPIEVIAPGMEGDNDAKLSIFEFLTAMATRPDLLYHVTRNDPADELVTSRSRLRSIET